MRQRACEVNWEIHEIKGCDTKWGEISGFIRALLWGSHIALCEYRGVLQVEGQV